MRRTIALLLNLVWVFSGARAYAHDADIVFVRVERSAPQDSSPRALPEGTRDVDQARDGGRVSPEGSLDFARDERAGQGGTRVREVATMTGATLALLAPVDPNGDGIFSEDEVPASREAVEAGFWESAPLSSSAGRCERLGTGIALKEGFVELTADFRCPSEQDLKQQFRILSVLPAGYRVVLGTQGQAGVAQRFAEGTQQTLFLDAEGGAEDGGPSGFVGWVLLGAEHIIQGYDHLAFLAALLLVASSWKRLLWMVTAFTLAHSITLGVTALGLVTLPAPAARWVEIAIAASVVFVAVENLVGVHEKYRPLLTFVFGLVHGFGFASVLAEYGLGNSAITALAGFNVGVELGQAVIVALLVPVLRLIRRREKLHRRVVFAGSTLIALVGAYWLVMRAFV